MPITRLFLGSKFMLIYLSPSLHLYFIIIHSLWLLIFCIVVCCFVIFLVAIKFVLLFKKEQEKCSIIPTFDCVLELEFVCHVFEHGCFKRSCFFPYLLAINKFFYIWLFLNLVKGKTAKRLITIKKRKIYSIWIF